jgi:glycosyltransferase involved in cell wall biosynthesis
MLVFAYACEPGKGSEPGAGWGLVREAAAIVECTILVGPEHRRGIEQYSNHSARFVEVPEPWWYSLARRHRTSRFLLYLSWLRRAYRQGIRLHRERPFDLTYHATYSAYWLPSPAISFGVPCIWGPVGGAVTTPLRLWPALGLRGVLEEILDLVAVRVLSMLPATRRTWRHATVKLLQNGATLDRLPKWAQEGAEILNHALLAEVPNLKVGRRGGEILFVGPLEARKGAWLAVRALAYTAEDVRLVVIGDGPERARLEALARRLRVWARIQFRGRLPHADVFKNFATCAAAVFTGLREEGGIGLAEAMLTGVPVIVLANGGARTIAEAATDASRVALIQPDTVEATARRIGEAMTRFSAAPSAKNGPILDQGKARRELGDAIGRALTSTKRFK